MCVWFVISSHFVWMSQFTRWWFACSSKSLAPEVVFWWFSDRPACNPKRMPRTFCRQSARFRVYSTGHRVRCMHSKMFDIVGGPSCDRSASAMNRSNRWLDAMHPPAPHRALFSHWSPPLTIDCWSVAHSSSLRPFHLISKRRKGNWNEGTFIRCKFFLLIENRNLLVLWPHPFGSSQTHLRCDAETNI